VRQIPGFICQPIEGVAWPPLQQTGRHTLADFERVKINEVPHQLPLFAQRIAPRPNDFHPPIRQNNIQLIYVIGSGSINRCVGPARVVGDHSAESRPRAGCHIRSETKSLWPQKMVQLIQHHARSDAHGPPLQVQIGDLAVVS
jgi:hypothetical protein